MDIVLPLLVLGTPSALIGAGIGYLTRHGHAPRVAFLGIGLFLTALGIAGMASIGVIIYPIGVLVLCVAIGKSIRLRGSNG